MACVPVKRVLQYSSHGIVSAGKSRLWGGSCIFINISNEKLKLARYLPSENKSWIEVAARKRNITKAVLK